MQQAVASDKTPSAYKKDILHKTSSVKFHVSLSGTQLFLPAHISDMTCPYR